jgi:hypothetical protein
MSNVTRRDAAGLTAVGAAVGLTALSCPDALGQEVRADRMIRHYRTDTLRVPDHVLYIANPGSKEDGGIAPFNEPYHFVPICSLELSDLRHGDVISVFAECQTTNPYRDPKNRRITVQFGSFVAFGDNELDMDKVYHEGRWICRPAGMNVTPDMEHLLNARVGSVKIGKDFPGGKWLHFVGYAASDARKKGEFLIADLGHLSIIQCRG